MTYYAQIGQDRYLDRALFRGQRHGVFVDVGAHDGVSLSNTCYFERTLGWRGVCLEPTPWVYDRLVKNRSCACVNAAAFSHEGRLSFRMGGDSFLNGVVGHHNTAARQTGPAEVVSVPCVTLTRLLRSLAVSVVDYLSIDTEGSELEVLKGLDLERVHVNVLDVEWNGDRAYLEALTQHLAARGFRRHRVHRFDAFFVHATRAFSWSRPETSALGNPALRRTVLPPPGS